MNLSTKDSSLINNLNLINAMDLFTDDCWIINNLNLINVEGLQLYASCATDVPGRKVVNEYTHNMISVKHSYGNAYQDPLVTMLLLHLLNVYKDVPRELPIIENIKIFLHSPILAIEVIILMTKALRYHELKHQFIYTSLRCRLLYLTLRHLCHTEWKLYDETTHGTVFTYLLHDLPTGEQLARIRTELEKRMTSFNYFFIQGTPINSLPQWSNILHQFEKIGLLDDSDGLCIDVNSIVLTSNAICPESIQQLCSVFPTKYESLDLNYFNYHIANHVLQDPFNHVDFIKNVMAHNGLRKVLLHEISRPSIICGNYQVFIDNNYNLNHNYESYAGITGFRTMVHLRSKPFFDLTKKCGVLLTNNNLISYTGSVSEVNGTDMVTKILTQSLWFHLKQTSRWYNELAINYKVKRLETQTVQTVTDHLNVSLLEYHKFIRLIIQTLYMDITTVLPFIVDILSNIFLSPLHPSSHAENRNYLLALVTHECKLSTDKNAPIGGITIEPVWLSKNLVNFL